MLTPLEHKTLRETVRICPPPRGFDLSGCKSPDTARRFWLKLQARGYAEIAREGRVQDETVQGEFVFLTEKGRKAAAEEASYLQHEEGLTDPSLQSHTEGTSK